MGPVIALLAFVCSVGNMPLAALLWDGGISFGGVIAFIFADLLVLPILNVYRKYYGAPMMWFTLGTYYASMAVAALIVELVFELFGLIPQSGGASVSELAIKVNYTTVLNVVFLMLAAALIRRFVKTRGPRCAA